MISLPSLTSMTFQSKGFEFFSQRSRIHDVLGIAAQLDAVVIHDGGQVIHFIMRPGHGRFPGLPLIAFAVAKEGIDMPGLLIQPARQRGTHRETKAPAPGSPKTFRRRGWKYGRRGPANGYRFAAGYRVPSRGNSRIPPGRHKGRGRRGLCSRQSGRGPASGGRRVCGA